MGPVMRWGLVTAALGAMALGVACTSSGAGPADSGPVPPSDAGPNMMDAFVSDAGPATGYDAGDAAITTSSDGGSLATGSSFNGFAVGAPLQAGTFTLSKPAFNLSRSCAGTICITGSF